MKKVQHSCCRVLITKINQQVWQKQTNKQKTSEQHSTLPQQEICAWFPFQILWEEEDPSLPSQTELSLVAAFVVFISRAVLMFIQFDVWYLTAAAVIRRRCTVSCSASAKAKPAFSTTATELGSPCGLQPAWLFSVLSEHCFVFWPAPGQNDSEPAKWLWKLNQEGVALLHSPPISAVCPHFPQSLNIALLRSVLLNWQPPLWQCPHSNKKITNTFDVQMEC